MIFYREPNQLVRDKKHKSTLFRFNEKGEFETDNPYIIEKAKGKFDYKPSVEKKVEKKPVKKTVKKPVKKTVKATKKGGKNEPSNNK